MTESDAIDNRIRFKTLNRLIRIDNRIGVHTFHNGPYFSLMNRYYIKQKCVQVLFDVHSFSNVKVLKSAFNLVRMIYRDLNDQDCFGLKVLRDGYNSDYTTIDNSKN